MNVPSDSGGPPARLDLRSGSRSTTILRRHIEQFEVVEVQVRDLEDLSEASGDASDAKAGTLFVLGLFLPTALSALTIDWPNLAAWQSGLYFASVLVFGIGSAAGATLWRRRSASAKSTYNRIMNAASRESRQSTK
jgi:hypothetical protein